MKILKDSDLLKKLSETNFLFLDTNSIITALSYKEDYGKLLTEINNSGCALLTIPSVAFEFTRGSQDLQTYNSRTDFLNSIATVYNVEKDLHNSKDLIVPLQKFASNASYTDFLLGVCSGKYGCGVLTENHKDFPLSVYDRRYILTLDTDGDQVRTHGIYFLSKTKLHRAASSLIEQI